MKIRCEKCGDDGGMTDLMEGLLEVWDDVGYDNYPSIYCPMCGRQVEVIEE